MNTQPFIRPNRSFARAGAVLLVLAALLAALPAARASAAQPFALATIGVSAQSGTLTYGTAGSATYTITLTADVTGDVPSTTLSATGLPAGVTGIFSPNPVSCSGVSCQVTSTLTLSTTTSAQPVTAQAFTVSGNPAATGGNGSGSLTIGRRPITVTATGDTKTYDGTATSAAVPTITLGSLASGDSAAWTQTFNTRNAGSNTLTPAGTVNDGHGGANYIVTLATAPGTINKKPITVTAVTFSKTYDGTTAATGAAPTYPALAPGDTTTTFIEAYDNRNFGVGNKVLTPSGIVNDGNSGLNYAYTYTPVGTGTINKLAIIVTAVTNTKTYDGTTTAANVPTHSALASGDTTVAFTETYDNRNFGAGNKTLTPSGIVNDGNSGLNYSYQFVPDATGTINKLPITVTAITNTKTYDGNTSAAAIPTYGALAAGDTTVAFIEAYNTKDVGNGTKILTPSGIVNDGNSGLNYAYTYTPFNTGTISPITLTVTGLSASAKVYDGTTAATLTGTPTLNGVILAEDVTVGCPTATFADKHANALAKAVTVTCTLGGTALGNYLLTQPSLSAIISPKPITVTAITNTKVYDGTTTAVALPTNSGLAIGTAPVDTAVFTEAYSDKNVGAANKTLIPSAVITDGNGGLNYTVTPVNFTTGTITAKPITVTAVTNTKTYDGTLTAAAIPTNTGLAIGTAPVDTAVFSEAYLDKNFGVGNKVLRPAAVITDGNAGLNYAVTLVDFTTGTINKRAITVSAVTNTKTYDGTLTAAAIPTITVGGPLPVGDTATLTEAYLDKNFGVGNKVLHPSAVILDGNAGLNYTVTLANFSTGTINKAPLTITAKNATKEFGTVLSFSGKEFTNSAMPSTDYVVSVSLSSLGEPADAPVQTYDIIASDASIQGGASNYNITYVKGTLTVVPPAPAFLATPASRNYGLVKVGTVLPAVFTVKNSGGSDLIFGPVALAGANSGQFVLVANTCAAATLAPNATCSVTASFKPTTAGVKSASIQFSDNTAAHTHAIVLTGKGALELALNGGFNAYPSASSKVPTGWVASGFAATDGKSTAVKREGVASVLLGNTSARTKTLKQTRTVAGGLAGTTLQLSVWARGQAIPASAGLVRMQVQLYNGTSLVQTSAINLPAGTYAFTQKKTAFVASRAYNRIVITLIYSKATGSAWFDGLSLLRSP